MTLKRNLKLVTLSDSSKLKLAFERYLNGRVAILFYDIDDLYSTLSCNVEDVEIADGEFIVKNWSENETFYPKVKHLFDDTGRTCNVGYGRMVPIWKLKPLDFAKVYG